MRMEHTNQKKRHFVFFFKKNHNTHCRSPPMKKSVLLLFVAMVAAVGSVQANGDLEDIPKIPIVNRTTEQIVLPKAD